ncbi:hypothetical protein MRB53_021091 [Persea americana]|uniref:Uncharacterized protein n=1 Tax=Persea americana TaxID=3435 RepID=A0ACC2L2W6_PERAE|nr:hypothetical protein MRB53_021091 [Persea americana]
MENPSNTNKNPNSTAPSSSTEKRKPRLIVRLGIFLISHSTIVSLSCCVAGFLSPHSPDSRQEHLHLLKCPHAWFCKSNVLRPGCFGSEQDGKIELSDALSLGLGYSIFSLLSKVTWLAKDIVWLAAESRYGEYASVSAWLRDYHNHFFFRSSGKLHVDTCLADHVHHERHDSQVRGRKFDVFRRAGTMAAALVFKIVDKQEEAEKDTLSIHAESSNGQMPNLDLINIVHYLEVPRQGLRVKVETAFSLLHSAWLRVVGEMLEWVSIMAGNLNPHWRFGIPAADYVEGTATLASSMYYEALGVPTGSHGALRDYQIDAITLEISPKISLKNELAHSTFLLRGGRLIEGVVLSVNNLLEKFHQSFLLYFLTSSNKLVSVYMIGFALLVLPLPVLAAALYREGMENPSNTNKNPNSAAPSSSTEKRKPQLIVRLGIFLISHSTIFSLLCCVAGFLSFLILPILAKNTYISENALMPGQDVLEANKMVKELLGLRFGSEELRMYVSLLRLV